MKRVLYFIAMAAIIFSTALSCLKEANAPEEMNGTDGEIINPQLPVNLVTWTFTAGTEGTRVTPMDGANRFEWEENDEVKVLYDGGSTTCTASVSDGVATFSPSVPEGISTIYLVYPSDMTASLDGDNLVVNMPPVQKNDLYGYFVAQANKNDRYVSFKHPVCYHKFVVDGDGADVTRLALTSAANTITATSIAVDFSDSEPAVAAHEGGASTITYDFSGEGTYYLPLIPVATAASDLTFQFYRGEDKTEKAGAINYGAALENARSYIVNWASLPAMATNRYVSTGGNDSNNGATSAKPWSFAKFKAFLENAAANGNPTRDAAALALFDGIKIHVAAGTYTLDSQIENGLAIKVNIIGADKATTIISSDGSSHRCLKLRDRTCDYAFSHLTFQGFTGDVEGAVIGEFNKGAASFTDCIFKNNATTDSKDAGVINLWSVAQLTLNGCLFKENSASGAKGGVINCNAGEGNLTASDCIFQGNSCAGGSQFGGGALSIVGGSASFENCKFIGNHTNTSSGYNAEMGGAVCVTTTGLVTFNKCLFKDNYATQGGAISIGKNNDSSPAANLYLNDCIFSGNYISYRYGTTMYSYKNAGIYLNNCSFADDTYSTTGTGEQCSWLNLKCDKFVLCNSTLIGTMRTNNKVESASAGYLVRFDTGAGSTHFVINSIAATTNSNVKSVKSTSTVHLWANRMAGTSGTCTAHSGNDRSMTDPVNYFAGLTWVAPNNADDYAWNTCYWSWTGKGSAWVSPTPDMVTLNGGNNTLSISSLLRDSEGDRADSADFYNWLVDIGVWNYDGRGHLRGTGANGTATCNWPGAYDGN